MDTDGRAQRTRRGHRRHGSQGVRGHTQWVSHYSDVQGGAGLVWADDGTTRLWFDPALPEERSGTHPDELLPVMHAIGFSLGTEPTGLDLSMEAAFALAEYLTGVRLHPDLLRNTTFTCGSIDIPVGGLYAWPGCAASLRSVRSEPFFSLPDGEGFGVPATSPRPGRRRAGFHQVREPTHPHAPLQPPAPCGRLVR
ncbi:DUF6461 domain-containing protein [Streptomyces cellostaticus]|uniref:DUF6461 domain-containing protein n=1 Tax=Streptomyces cellostaticus TaxID=67285 RepID=UPI00082A4D12|nr:DUF6461 domain-containing protein [Streptomyces cellostaticus]GHI04211.1 hypothetical protein Scel_25320 [Streptomyces cellostaticus]